MNEDISLPKLHRSDLVEMDAQLFAELRRFVPCTGYALYFPTGEVSPEPELLAREHRLLLPLCRDGETLAVAMLHGVRVREARRALPLLPAVAALTLDMLTRIKAQRTDVVTGLATEDTLYARMKDEAARVREQLTHPSPEESHNAPLHRLCMGLVMLRMTNGRELADIYGFTFTDRLLRRVARALRQDMSSDVLAARVGRFGMALLLPAISGRKACQKVAESALRRMEQVEQVYRVSQQVVRPRLCAGHAIYPQDMEGPEFSLSMYEQSRRLMERARLASREAARSGEASLVMPFARILQDGGVILESQPQGRVRISLGRRAKAREGQRFTVCERTADGSRYRGEIVLLQVREHDAVAETLHLADAASPLVPGQRLSLLGDESVRHWGDEIAAPDGSAAAMAADAAGTPDVTEDSAAGERGAARAEDALSCPEEAAAVPAGTSSEAGDATATRSTERGQRADAGRMPLTQAVVGEISRPAGDAPETDRPLPAGRGPLRGFYGHGDFVRLFAQEREACAQFALVLLRLDVSDMADPARQRSDLGHAAQLWRARFGEAGSATVLAGLYGGNSLIFFHPAVDAASLLPAYAALCRELEQGGQKAACGLAAYPFLQFRKGEMLDCALKALDYSLLLPSPHAGICNSLALNISADRRYSLGDVFGAVDEYKLALLADDGNVLARNSLGVCMAALGRHHEARRHFLEALRRCQDTAQTAQTRYNLGTVCQHLGERRAAARYYRQCLAAVPDHLYAHLRLGQLCEESGRRAEARRHYEEATRIEDARQAAGTSPGSPSVARRYLARVAVRQRRGGEARELLHEALLRDPEDASSMLLMAKLYLDGNEDPSVAELLARKSVRLRDTAEGWCVLARALRAQNRENEARLAEARALRA